MAETPGGIVGPGRSGISISRTFDTSRAEVWREWTEPANFADWFGGVSGEVPLESVSMDVRPGGRWRLTMFAGAERRRIDWHGEYIEVVEPERLVLTMSDLPGLDRWERITIDLVDLGDGRTEMRFHQEGVLSQEQYRKTRSGWSGFFDRMAERLAGS